MLMMAPVTELAFAEAQASHDGCDLFGIGEPAQGYGVGCRRRASSSLIPWLAAAPLGMARPTQ